MARRKKTRCKLKGGCSYGPRTRKRKQLGVKHTTQRELLAQYARDAGLFVASWSPGDGVTRYRFFDKPGNTYFGPQNGICTELGLKKAWKFLQTGTCSVTRRRR
jgi:hypothetical protein